MMWWVKLHMTHSLKQCRTLTLFFLEINTHTKKKKRKKWLKYNYTPHNIFNKKLVFLKKKIYKEFLKIFSKVITHMTSNTYILNTIKVITHMTSNKIKKTYQIWPTYHSRKLINWGNWSPHLYSWKAQNQWNYMMVLD